MPTFEEIRRGADNRKLIRKYNRAVSFIAPQSVPLPTSLFEVEPGPPLVISLIDLKELGWLPLGLVAPDGYTFEREIETDDVDALGYSSSQRSDTVRVPRSISTTLLQSGSGAKHINELLYGVDLSGLVPDAQTGEIYFDEPELPIDREWRALVVAVDGPADEEWVRGKAYGSVKLSGGGGETWGQEGASSNEISLNIQTDEETGTPVRHFFGGTGFKKYEDVLGYAA